MTKLKYITIFLYLVLTVSVCEATTIELIQNGDFETGDMTGWSSIGNWGASWGVQYGSIGMYHVHPMDHSHFAAAWNTSYHGAKLYQKADISSYQLLDNKLHVQADLIYSKDAIRTYLQFYNSSGILFSTTYIGGWHYNHYQNIPGNFSLNAYVNIPTNTSAIAFVADGWVRDGRWLDAGIDQVSMTVNATNPVPEPSSCYLLGSALLLFARLTRRKS